MELLVKKVREAGFYSFSETLCDSLVCQETRYIFAQLWVKGKGYGGRSLWCTQLGSTYAITLWTGASYWSEDIAVIERVVLTFLRDGQDSYQLPQTILNENILSRDDELIERLHGYCPGHIIYDDSDES